MSSKPKKKILIKVPKTKIYLPFIENRIPIQYVSSSIKANIISNYSFENYNNLIPRAYQTVPSTIDSSFEDLLNERIKQNQRSSIIISPESIQQFSEVIRQILN